MEVEDFVDHHYSMGDSYMAGKEVNFTLQITLPWICLWFFTLYHGKSSFNHHFGIFRRIFVTCSKDFKQIQASCTFLYIIKVTPLQSVNGPAREGELPQPHPIKRFQQGIFGFRLLSSGWLGKKIKKENDGSIITNFWGGTYWNHSETILKPADDKKNRPLGGRTSVCV